MGTAKELGEEYLETEISKITDRLDLYYSLYHVGKVKCITLKRLIDSKEEELRLLHHLRNEIKEKNDKD